VIIACSSRSWCAPVLRQCDLAGRHASAKLPNFGQQAAQAIPAQGVR
jgi:hypothetical protein